MEKDGKNRVLEFFTTRNNRLKRYVHRKIQSISEMDAEDIVEEVMLSLFARAEASGPIENLAAYAYRSLHNKIVDYLRRDSKTVPLNDLEDEGRIPVELASMSAANGSGEFERAELRHRIFTAIDTLEPKQRAVFIATEIEGMSFRGLSDLWGEPMGTLLSRKCRAVKALQEMLKDLMNEQQEQGKGEY